MIVSKWWIGKLKNHKIFVLFQWKDAIFCSLHNDNSDPLVFKLTSPRVPFRWNNYITAHYPDIDVPILRWISPKIFSFMMIGRETIPLSKVFSIPLLYNLSKYRWRFRLSCYLLYIPLNGRQTLSSCNFNSSRWRCQTLIVSANLTGSTSSPGKLATLSRVPQFLFEWSAGLSLTHLVAVLLTV